jgi:nitrate reductase (cytochrome), electron transfer subunit
MTVPPSRPRGLLLGLFLTGCIVTAIAAVVQALGRPAAPRPVKPQPVTVAVLASPREPIPGEAQVFRTRPDMLAIEPEARRERRAHPRTLKTFRYLRAFPGAPPRIPHGLTQEEFRAGTCKTCHERGGYSSRFAAYVPVTPHPDMGLCLQCHVGDGGITGISQASSDPNARCRQCHGPNGPPRADTDSGLDWRTTAWPALPPRLPHGNPPPIPHDLQLRGNCLTCHAGPAAVAEIRTSHPEWADCRQCHLATEAAAGDFARPTSTAVAPGRSP